MIVADPRRLESANKHLKDVQAADYARIRSTGQLVIVEHVNDDATALVAWDGKHDTLPLASLSICPPGGSDFDRRKTA